MRFGKQKGEKIMSDELMILAPSIVTLLLLGFVLAMTSVVLWWQNRSNWGFFLVGAFFVVLATAFTIGLL